MPLGASRLGRMNAKHRGTPLAKGGTHAPAGTERRLLTAPTIKSNTVADMLKAKSPEAPTTLPGAQERKTTATQLRIPTKEKKDKKQADQGSPIPNTSAPADQPYSPTDPKPFNNGTSLKSPTKPDFEAEKERLRLKGRANKQLKEKLRLDLGQLQSTTVK